MYQGEEIGMTNVRFASIDDYRDIETLNMYREAVGEKGADPADVMEMIYAKSRDNARTPMQCNAARTVWEVVFVAPATEPSACPKRTRRLP